MDRTLPRVLLALLWCALGAGLVAACGSDEGSSSGGVQELLDETFDASTTALENGRLDASLRFEPEGLLALGGPIVLKASGPFAPPRLDLELAATLVGQEFDARALSTGSTAYLVLDGRPYTIDDADAKPPAGKGIGALGIDPRAWIKAPRERKGTTLVAGVETIRIGGGLNVAALLDDLDALLSKAGGSSGSGGELLTPALKKQLARVVDSATVDIWTGAADKILRQVVVKLKFSFATGTSPITGLDGGTIELRVVLDDVNTTKLAVAAPAGARPLAQLTGAGGIANVLQGIVASLATASGGAAGGALLNCVIGARENSTELVRCLSKLAQ